MLQHTEVDQPHTEIASEYASRPLMPQAVIDSPQAESTPLTREQMKSLSKRLSARDKQVQATAHEELFGLRVTQLVALLAYERMERKRRMRQTGIIFGTLILLMTIITIAVPKSNMFIFFGSFSGMIASASAYSKSSKFGAMALARYENIDHIGELISALEIQEKDVQESVRPALVRLLPALKTSDSALIGADMRTTIRRFLDGKLTWLRRGTTNIATDTDLAMALLEALPRVGDSSFIEPVSRLASGRGRWTDPRVAEAASNCLPFLKQISSQAQASSELLRGSAASSIAGADSLVRAVSAPSDLHEAELLRPEEQMQRTGEPTN